ncbi:MAG: 4-(cytidine 5'-diphospho)-2-C-methyl-D-erythritol kinase [Elainellaceae cyanobacterium]
MRSYSLIAPAKINLYLEIIDDRPDGYHELAMVLQSIALADQIELRSLSVDQIRVRCDHPGVPVDTSNLAYRAADLMRQQFSDVFDRYGGVEITIQKMIPIGAGLAGGSANAAAVLVGLNLMWQLGLTQAELQELGSQIGSDVPFCLAGGTALATGRGELLSALPTLENRYLVLAKYRNLEVSTAWAYKTYRQQFGDTYAPSAQGLNARQERVHSGAIVTAITHHDYAKIGQLLHNDLERVVLPAYPQVAKLKDALSALTPLGAMMSGSGPTVFALAESRDHASHIRNQIRLTIDDPSLDVWVTQFSSVGIHLAH